MQNVQCAWKQVFKIVGFIFFLLQIIEQEQYCDCIIQASCVSGEQTFAGCNLNIEANANRDLVEFRYEMGGQARQLKQSSKELEGLDEILTDFTAR